MVLDSDQCYYQSLARVRELTTVRAFQAKNNCPSFQLRFQSHQNILGPPLNAWKFPRAVSTPMRVSWTSPPALGRFPADSALYVE